MRRWLCWLTFLRFPLMHRRKSLFFSITTPVKRPSPLRAISSSSWEDTAEGMVFIAIRSEASVRGSMCMTRTACGVLTSPLSSHLADRALSEVPALIASPSAFTTSSLRQESTCSQVVSTELQRTLRATDSRKAPGLAHGQTSGHGRQARGWYLLLLLRRAMTT